LETLFSFLPVNLKNQAVLALILAFIHSFFNNSLSLPPAGSFFALFFRNGFGQKPLSFSNLKNNLVYSLLKIKAYI
jgi:hypothetical protein